MADEIPTGRFVSARRLGPHRNRNGDVRSRAGRRQELHGPGALQPGRSRTESCTSPGQPRSRRTPTKSLRTTRRWARLYTAIDRARNPRLCLRNLCLPPADALRCRRDPGDARDHLDPGALHGAFGLSPEHGRSDRPRIAIDYSLLIVYRYREERAKGGTKEDAIARTMNTAGRAVVFSGTAVAIRLALMLAMPLPFMRGFGLGGLVIPMVSIVCALTLLPVSTSVRTGSTVYE